MYDNLAWAVIGIAFFSFLAVNSWLNNNRREREAYYKTEAIKKIAETQGNSPEVVAMLREAMETKRDDSPNPFVVSPQWRKEREAYYRSETLKKLAESPGPGAEATIRYLREEEREEERRIGQRRRAGLRLAGLITAAVGIGATALLWVLDPAPGVFLAGLIPTLVGVALVAFSFMPAEGDAARPPV